MSHPDILERSTQTVTKVLCTAILKSCPISRTPKPNRSTWWTPELGQIRKETRRLYNRAKVGNCQGDWNAYHLGFKIFKKKWKKIWPAPLRSPDFRGSTCLSVETALHEVVGSLERSLQRKEFALAASLDIEGAFNNVRIESITTALVKIGSQPTITQWLGNMLRYRVINALHLDNKKEGYERNPTGGVTSPLLWNLVLNGLLLRLKHTGCNVTAYADDLVLLITGKFLPTISELMENALGLTLRPVWGQPRKRLNSFCSQGRLKGGSHCFTM
ncbi:hypothetical protein ACLKA7_007638 [Drosophila subpalustris]